MSVESIVLFNKFSTYTDINVPIFSQYFRLLSYLWVFISNKYCACTEIARSRIHAKNSLTILKPQQTPIGYTSDKHLTNTCMPRWWQNKATVTLAFEGAIHVYTLAICTHSSLITLIMVWNTINKICNTETHYTPRIIKSSSEIFKTWGPYLDNYHLSLPTNALQCESQKQQR